MLRKLSAVVAAAAALGFTALPASAATAATHAKPHAFSIPDAPGVKAWGSYLKSGRTVKVTVCVKDTSRAIFGGAAIGVAFNSAGKDKPVTASAIGLGHSSCRSMTTTFTRHLYVDSVSATLNGKPHVSRVKRIY